ncbi:hypothetical protein HJC23_013620 [Cyclotella cryptica]|uniref:HMG box domain-containing protein n=1 Tax=Cyclotella cryptica TaxID=29204 RepID=A0ABD3PR46_9STRA|eukprot:CCRYP_012609-RA/>CCRYP_012609-RA protein AED:0.16 eAED:0.16 QI:0/-1/0/1/-1/1/1/0/332
MEEPDQDGFFIKSTMAATKRKKTGKRKDGRPVRPLSAYNIFFQMERKKVIKDQSNQNAKHATGGFGTLARKVSEKWKTVDAALKLELEAMANEDKQRYKHEVEEWKLAMLKEANIAMKEVSKTAPTQSHASDAGAKKVAKKNAHRVTPCDIKCSTLSRSNSTLDICGPTLPYPSFETRRNVQSVVGDPCLSSDEVSFTVNLPSLPLRRNARSDAMSQTTAPDNIYLSLPPANLDNQITTDLRSPSAPSEAAQWHGFCSPCSSLDEKSSPANFSRPSARVSYCDYHGDTFTNVSPRGQRSPLLKNEDEENIIYMRGYLEGFKAAREMWGLKGL